MSETTTPAHKTLLAEIAAEFDAIKAEFETKIAALDAKIKGLPEALKTDIEDGIARLRSAL